MPILHEIRHALHNLLTKRQETTLDLRNLPLSKTDREQLLLFLGKGEVTAELKTLGHSLIWETSFSGIWVVEHYDADEHLLGQYLEITWMPMILNSQSQDIETSLATLQTHLTQFGNE